MKDLKLVKLMADLNNYFYSLASYEKKVSVANAVDGLAQEMSDHTVVIKDVLDKTNANELGSVINALSTRRKELS